ncbi:MAG: aminomethyl transferase family protein [Deltaproteobacteria bacterium]|nr:aminomethyl transferase family protein [Deltaproteobacteria bacterium]
MSLELPLHSRHVELGATFEEHAGFHVPLRYRETADELASLRTEAALLDVSDRGRIRVTGGERASFLQGQLSNDVLKTAAGRGCHATLLTRTGKLVSDLYLWCGADEHWIDTDAERGDVTLATLDRFLISEDAELSGTAAEWAHLAVVGPGAAGVVAAVLGGETAALEPLTWVALGDGSHVARRRGAGADLFDVWVPVALATHTWDRLIGGGAVPIGRAAWDLATLEAGEARWGIDVDDSNLPLEANLNDAISYTKGCYVGQEVIAKATHLGRINKRLVGLAVADGIVPGPNAAVEVDGEGEPVGRVTRAALSPTLGKTVALAYIKWKYVEPGTAVTVRRGSGDTLAATVVALPFLASRR